jgi:hypothetical protein
MKAGSLAKPWKKTYRLLRQNPLLNTIGFAWLYSVLSTCIMPNPKFYNISVWFGLFLRVCTNAAFRYLAIVLRMRRPLQYIL